MNTDSRKLLSLGPITLLIAVVVIAFMIALVPEPELNEDSDGLLSRKDKPSVELQLIERDNYRSHVDAQGLVASRWSGALKSGVAGKVIEVSDHFLDGSSFKKGDILLRLNDVQYRAELARTSADVAAAEQVLAVEQQRSDRALDDWNRAGFSGDPDALALRKPQLKVAKARVKSAKLARDSARSNLLQTVIKAPYDGAVKKRIVSLGGFTEAGSELATIFSTRSLRVGFELSQKQMQVLELQIGADIEIRSAQSGRSWAARIDRMSKMVSLQQRQRTVIVKVINQPDMPLNGEFVEARFTGIVVDNLFKLPEAGVSKSGLVWYTNSQLELQSFPVETAFTEEGYIYTKAPESLSRIQLVLSPGSNLYAGMGVQTAQGYLGVASKNTEDQDANKCGVFNHSSAGELSTADHMGCKFLDGSSDREEM